MHKLLLEIPNRIETERLYLRSYAAGDGKWYYAMSLKNRDHLARYEADNVAMTMQSEEHAEIVMRDLVVDWAARNHFFLGAFDKKTNNFVAQIYVGPVNWDTPEFTIGFFADVDHQGHGFVTEAVKATLGWIFKYLQARRVNLECDDTNLHSQRIAERCHMVKEAHLRENKLHPDGTLSGTMLYGLLSREFKALE